MVSGIYKKSTNLLAGDLYVLVANPADTCVDQVCHDVLSDLEFTVTVHRSHQLEAGYTETAVV